MRTHSGPKLTFNNWEIAVLVNVVHVREDNNNVTRIKLDLNSESAFMSLRHVANDFLV